MTDIINYGAGGGIESDATVKAKVFVIKFLKQCRQIIKNVDIIIKIEHQVHCPPMLLRESEGLKEYQVDAAVIIPGYEKFNFAIEIDGTVGHNHNWKDEARDEWIYQNRSLPIFRLKLDWIKDWMKRNDFVGMLSELIYRHKTFKFGKLPKNPMLHLAYQKRGELFNQ